MARLGKVKQVGRVYAMEKTCVQVEGWLGDGRSQQTWKRGEGRAVWSNVSTSGA